MITQPAPPHLCFFRHEKGKGVSDKTRWRFGKNYLWKWWKRACQNLGIEGVELYGGTRHSTVRALRRHRTPEEIRRDSIYKINKAFELYYKVKLEDIRATYRDTAERKKGEVVSLKSKVSAG